jgi:hypothetical protein
MGASSRLLDLQRLDLTIDRLRARKAVLESGDDLAAARREADAAEARYGELRLQIDALDRDTTKLEHEIDSLRQKSEAEERRMTSGAVANARELGAIGHEIENLRRRISDREDEELAILERREVLEVAVKEAEAEAGTLRARVEEVQAASGDELAAVDAELATAGSERPELTAGLEAELLELYEDLRRQKKGVGAVALVDGVCQGCHEQLSAVELDRVRHTHDVPRCEHCRRILVL